MDRVTTPSLIEERKNELIKEIETAVSNTLAGFMKDKVENEGISVILMNTITIVGIANSFTEFLANQERLLIVASNGGVKSMTQDEYFSIPTPNAVLLRAVILKTAAAITKGIP